MDNRAVDDFLQHFRIRPQRGGRDLLHELGHAFSRLPYENISKLRLRDCAAKQTLNIRDHEAEKLGRRFGIDGQLVERAYQLVSRAKTS